MRKGPVLCCLMICAFLFTPSLFSQFDAKRIFEEASQGVLVVVAYGQNREEIGRGSGFAISEDLVVTPFSLISRANSAEAFNVKGRRFRVEGVVAIYREMNTALIRVRGRLQPLTLESSRKNQNGASLILVGANESGQIVPQSGQARGEHMLFGAREILSIETARLPETFNGAAVMDQNGRVVAMLLVMERRILAGITAANIQGIYQGGVALDLEDMVPEVFFESPEGYLLIGQAAFAQNDLMTARIHLENAVGMDESFLDVQELLARIYREQKDYAAALSAFQRIIDSDPQRAGAFQGLGSVYMRVKNYDEAVQALDIAAALEPQNSDILYDLVEALEEKKDFGRAASTLEALLALEPENALTGTLKLGELLTRLKDHEKAGDAFARVGALTPEDPRNLLQAVEAYKRAGRLDKAEEILETLAQNHPDDARGYYGQILTMYDESGDGDKAVAAARRIINLDPKNELAVYNLGVIHQKLGRYDEAIQIFFQCLEINPKYAAAWFNIGTCHTQLKRWPESIEAFSRYTELAPDDPQGCNAVGYGYLQMKRYEEALNPLTRCVELEPNNATFQYNLAIVFIQLGDLARARDIQIILQGLDAELADKLSALLR